jgi:hypothetical protein
MIDFYRVWKEDKDADPKPKKKSKQFECKLCSKQTNGLADHVKQVHGGPDAWKRYLAAEQQAKHEAFRRAYNSL